jgi:hypothetical protein
MFFKMVSLINAQVNPQGRIDVSLFLQIFANYLRFY